MLLPYGPVCLTCISKSDVLTRLDILISECGINSSYTHNLAKSQSYQGLKLLPSDIKFMKMVNSMLLYHRFQEK